MDIQSILGMLTKQFGNNFDVAHATQLLGKMDLKGMDFGEIVKKLQSSGLKGLSLDLDGDGKQEPLMDELKGMAAKKLGGLGGLFGGK